MKRRLILLLGIALLSGLCMPAAFAQLSGSVSGVCKDESGNPIVDAAVEYDNTQNGRKYTMKTNKKGEYFSLGVEPGTYNVLITKDGKPVDKIMNFRVQLGDNKLDSDLKARSGGNTIPTEQVQKMQEEHTKALKENEVIKLLNQKLAAASQASQAGDFDGAIAQLTEGTQLDPNRDLLWFKLADAYAASAKKQSDSAEKAKRLDTAIADYQKAVDLKQKATEADPKNAKPLDLAIYYNNLGGAFATAGKADDAAKAYSQAAQLNPAGAAQYYFNTGAVLVNSGRVDDAIAAFDKCIAADPTRADAYYQKGLSLLGKATLKGDKMIAPPGTEEAFSKYLELKPTGEYADVAKQMLAQIGASVETEYGKKKSKK